MPPFRSYSRAQGQGQSSSPPRDPNGPPGGYRPGPPSIDKYKLMASVCREKFANFVKYFWHLVPGSGGTKMRWNWHMDLICGEMQAIAERVFAWEPAAYDVVLNISPGTSKSTIASILFQPWVWTRMPEARFITATHTQNLVLALADRSLQVMKSPQYQICYPEVILRRSAQGSFANTLGGDRLAATVGGQNPTGFHGHFLMGDDLINPETALSEVGLQTARSFVENYLATRQVDKLVSVMFVVMQRLGVGDPTDVMMEISRREGARPVRKICLPCDDSWPVIEPPEVRAKYAENGGLMDPVRLSRVALNQARARGELFYATQFGQNPTLRGGGIFKAEFFNNRKKAAPYNSKRILYVDRASTADGGCATACVLLARDVEGAYWVEHIMTGHWEPVERLAKIRALALRFRSRYGKYEPTIWVEKEGGSVDADAWLMMLRALEGFTVRKHNVAVLGSKDMRAEPWSAQLAGGNVFLVDNGESEGKGTADWDIEGYVREHCNFRVDTTRRGRRVGGRCLVAGTMIETEEGPLPIEEVRAGDRVLTRSGYQEVEWTGITGYEEELVSVEFSNGAILSGTEDHPVLTRLHGFIRLGELRGGDEVTTLSEGVGCPGRCIRRSAYFARRNFGRLGDLPAVHSIAEWPIVTGDVSRTMSLVPIRSEFTGDERAIPTLMDSADPFIGSSGRSITDLFRRATIFTTKTVTLPTTRLPIWRALRRPSMLKSMPTSNALRDNLLISPASARKQRSGTALRRAENGTVSTPKEHSPSERPASLVATTVERSICPASRALLPQNHIASVRGSVVNAFTTPPIGGKWTVCTAVRRFSARGAGSSAQSPVPQSTTMPDGVPVYNLKVKNHAEFFANGILTHNCDMVDASSGGFAVFVKGGRPIGMRTYALGSNRRDRGLRLVACSREELSYLDVEGRNTVLVLLQDPPPPEAGRFTPSGPIIVADVGITPTLTASEGVMPSELESGPRAESGDRPALPTTVSVGPGGGGGVDTVPTPNPPPLLNEALVPVLANSHPLGKNLDTMSLFFADIDPADYQNFWDNPLPEYYMRTPAQVQMTREQGRSLWSFLLRKRDPAYDVIVICDPGGGDRRATSVAQALADTLRLPRSVIYSPDDPEAGLDGDPGNPYLYDTVKGSRHLVMT